MKPGQFTYHAPRTVEEAVALLGEHADSDGRIIAGGQSLVPTMALRLAQPAHRVDINTVAGLDRIEVIDGELVIGAGVRHSAFEREVVAGPLGRLLKQVVHHIAHYPIRSRGTVGGSLAHADTAAELPGIAITCDAEIVAVGSAGERRIAAKDFFAGPMMTTLAHDELVTELRLPPWPPARRWAFTEFARQHGAFALAGIALYYDVRDGLAANTHIGVIGASSQLQRVASAEAELDGRVVDADAIAQTARVAAAAIDAYDDIDAPAAYRRALVETLTARALQRAAAR